MFEKAKTVLVLAPHTDDGVLVQCGDDIYCIRDFKWGGPKLEVGMGFEQKSQSCWDWEKLPMEDSTFCGGYEEIPEAFKKVN